MKVNGVAKKVKRGTALLLAGLMMLSSVDISGLEVNAAEESVYEAGAANAQAENGASLEETDADAQAENGAHLKESDADAQAESNGLLEEYGAETQADDAAAEGNIKLTITDSDEKVTEETFADLKAAFADTASNGEKYTTAQQTVIRLMADDSSLQENHNLDDFGKNVILDLNGHTLETSGEFSLNSGSLTITSSEPEGKIQCGNEKSNWGIGIASANCTIGTGVTIRSCASESVFISSDGICTVKDDAVIINTNTEISTIAVAALNGGTVIVEDEARLEAAEGTTALYVTGNGNAIISGGTFSRPVDFGSKYNAKISGGRFEEGIISEYRNKSLADIMENDCILLSTADDTEIDLSQYSVYGSVYAKKLLLEITKQPSIPEGEDSVVDDYETAPALSVEAQYGNRSGDDFTYQWYRKTTGTDGDGNATVTDTPVDDATQSTFQIPTGLSAGSYTYFCRVTYGEKTVDSDTVTFTVAKAVIQLSINETMSRYASWDSAMEALQKASADGRLKDAKVVVSSVENYNGSILSTNSYTIDFDSAEVHFDCSDCSDIRGDSSEPLIKIKNAKNVTFADGYFDNSSGAVFSLDNSNLTVDKAYMWTENPDEVTMILENNATLYVRSDVALGNIKITGTGNVIKANLAYNYNETIYMEDIAEANIYYVGVGIFKMQGAKSGAKQWFRFTLLDNMSQEEAFPSELNKGNITTFDGNIYGLWDETNPITVSDNICTFVQVGEKHAIEGHKLTITDDTAYPTTFLTHAPDKYGYCQTCGKTDLAVAYANGYLTIEGLEGRTYDTYPQILSKITLTTESESKELTAPQYGMGHGTLGFGGDNPANSNAEYTVVYKNNVIPYALKEGDAGFDKEKAPQVTITGKGDYAGSLTLYFTIGEGEMQLGDFVARGSRSVVIYDGRQHKAWEESSTAILFKADLYDKELFGEREYIYTCTPTDAKNYWYGSAGFNNPNKIEYSTDDQKTWILEREAGAAGNYENMYMLTDAGEYPFYIRVTNEYCGTQTLISKKYIAKITPRNLSESEITLEELSDVTAYYTGKPVIPTDWDEKITDTGLGKSIGTYTLVKDKDFTVSGSDNTDVTEDGSKATIIFTGTGNYTGERTAEFDIDYAFSAEQTSASKNVWYNQVKLDGHADADITMENADAPIIFTTEAKEGILTEPLTYYDSLTDAINGTNPVEEITGEGKVTKKLYVKDAVGYISKPVEVTVHIDTTAPTWGDDDQTEGYGINIRTNWWHTFLNKVSFGLFYNDKTLDVQIVASDATSGVDKYYYYIQTVSDEAAAGEYTALTGAELDKLSKDVNDATEGFVCVAANAHNKGTVTGALSKDGTYIIYAYAVDKAGNKSGYISTEGIGVDTKDPDVTVSTPSKDDGALKDTGATITVTLDEDATLMYFYVDENRYNLVNAEGTSYDYLVEQYGVMWEYVQPYAEPENRPDAGPLAKKIADGKWEVPFAQSGDLVTIAKVYGSEIKAPAYKLEAKKGVNEITVTGLQPSERFQVWIAAIDKAGNFSGYSVTSLTTTKAIPKITTEPKLTGVYGDTAKDLEAADGVAEYNGQTVAGTWAITDTDASILEVGTTKTCQVTFTPKDTDKYENVVMEVVPTIEKRPITINVQDQNMSVTYGEELPQISTGDFDLADGFTLVGSDDKGTIAATLVMVTSAKKGSDAGTYAFTLESNSPNYAVTAKYYGKLDDPATSKDAGTLTINKAKGEIIKGAGYEETHKVIYGDPAFALAAIANHSESKLVYTVSSSRNSSGVLVADDQIIAVDADGNVTIKNVGDAYITISLPESKNYTKSEPLKVYVVIRRKALSLKEKREYLCIRENSDTIDIASLLPEDRGETTVGRIDVLAGEGFFSVEPTLQEELLSYTIRKGDAGGLTYIDVRVDSDNYIIDLRITVSRIAQKQVAPRDAVTLVSGTLTYGEPLSKLVFDDVIFIDDSMAESTDEKIVSGTLEWVEPDCKPTAGEHYMQWRFTPDNEEYAPTDGGVHFTVQKAVPKVTELPTVADRVYAPSKALLDSDLTGGTVLDVNKEALAGAWSWQNGDVVPTVDNTGYTAVFTPDDTDNYETVTKTIAVNVAKATPVIKENPSALEITYGDNLGKAALTGGTVTYSDSDDTVVAGAFTWKDAAAKPIVADSNSRKFTVVFTPADTINYEAVETQITVKVKKAPVAPDMPGSTMNVPNKTEKISEISLPKNWVWQDADKDTALEVGVTVSATAVYTGADKGNYETESVEVSVTRSACDHANTELRNAKAASCQETGYTGDTYCKDCGELVASGTVIPLADHQGGTATCIARAVCTVCGNEYGAVDAGNHVNTELRGFAEPTCTTDGYTGDTYCKDCGELLTSGMSTAALGHSYTSEVTKNPTTTEEGVMTYTCDRCGHSYTTSIAKLPDNSGKQDTDKSDKGDQTGSKTDKTDKNNQSDKSDKSDKSDQSESNSESGKTDKTDKTDKNNQSDKSDKSDKGDQSESNSESSKTDKTDKDNQSDKNNQSDKYDKKDQSASNSESNQTDANNQSENASSVLPFVRDNSEKSGWQMISDQVEQTNEGGTVAIDMNGTTTVPSDIFEQLQGKDIEIVFQMKDGITWTINGKDVTDIRGDIDFGVTFGSDAGKNIPVDVINQVTGEHYSVNLTLAYDGEFGFTAALTVNMEEENAGYYANLFYYNPENDTLEFMCAGEIEADGNVALTFNHASDYTIVISDTIMDGENVAANDSAASDAQGDNAQSGDNSASGNDTQGDEAQSSDVSASGDDAQGDDVSASGDNTQGGDVPASGDDTQTATNHDTAWKGWWVILIGIGLVVVIGFGMFVLKRKEKKD